MSLYGPGALTQILDLVKRQTFMAQSAVNAPFPHETVERHSQVAFQRKGVQNAESNLNFSEITAGLSQCAYGSSPLK